MKTPECHLDATIACYMFSPLGVDPIQVEGLTFHIHSRVGTPVC
jgi:hypothetical protein